jgi:hypothetical protein
MFAFVLLVSVFCFTANAASLDDAELDALSQIPPCAVSYTSHEKKRLVANCRTATMYY